VIVTVYPGPARGRLDAPPSKSYTHRALVAGYFARCPYRVLRPLVADDTRATRRGLGKLGRRFRVARGVWIERPAPGRRTPKAVSIDCGESGTTLRFLASVAATSGRCVRFTGRPQLAARPMEDLLLSLESAGVRVERSASGSLPVTVTGPLHPGRFSVSGTVSSQYVSSLLLALPTLDAPSTLQVRGRRVSEPYIAATLAVMRAHGVRVLERPDGWTVPAPQLYRGRSFEVPGDASSAAYLWTAAAVSGGRVTVDRVPLRWPQADRRILELLRAAGAKVTETAASASVEGPLDRPFSVDLTASPDLYPLAGVIAAVVPGRSQIQGAAHVVFKESNRRDATVALVGRIGARCRASRTGLTIRGTDRPKALRLRGLDDHRLVMSAAVAALATPSPSTIADGRAVRKSFPGFWRAFRQLGVAVAEGP